VTVAAYGKTVKGPLGPALGGTVVSDGTSLAAFDSPTEIRATEVHDWNLRLIGPDEKRKAALQLELDGRDAVRRWHSARGLTSQVEATSAILRQCLVRTSTPARRGSPGSSS
jgi:hypothetical protein